MICPHCHKHIGVLFCEFCKNQPGGSMKTLNEQIRNIRVRLISELDEYKREMYALEGVEGDFDGAQQYWEELPLNDLKDEHRRAKVDIETLRAAKSRGEA